MRQIVVAVVLLVVLAAGIFTVANSMNNAERKACQDVNKTRVKYGMAADDC